MMRKPHGSRAGFSGTHQHPQPPNDMPSSTPKQARTMAGAAHNPAFAKEVGIPQDVAQEFNQADTGTAVLKHGLEHQPHTQHPRNGRNG